MKILVIGSEHKKNRLGAQLMNNENFQFHYSFNQNVKYDWIMSTDSIRQFDLGYDYGLLFGPSMWFPPAAEGARNLRPNQKYFCNVLSPWLKNLCSSIYPDIKFIDLPFAVDVNKFTPSEKTGLPVIYIKRREVSFLDKIIKKLNSQVIIFDYSKGYDENYFIECISKAPYALWLGITESQGFAFQEILSCNTPLFVFDCKTARPRNDPGNPLEHFLPNNPLLGTTASYFDHSCGLISSDSTWEDDILYFMKNIEMYSPRKFVLENLSPEACRNLWITKLN